VLVTSRHIGVFDDGHQRGVRTTHIYGETLGRVIPFLPKVVWNLPPGCPELPAIG
jgi:hypothetical protein